MAKKVALVLSGGGFKGAFQVGAIKALQENWTGIVGDDRPFRFDIVAGVSVGALNGLLVSQEKYDDLYTLWNKVATDGVGVIYESKFIDTQPDHSVLYPKPKFTITWDAVKSIFPKTTKNLLWKLIFNRKGLAKTLKEELRSFKSLANNEPLRRLITKYAVVKNIKHTLFMCGYVSLDNGKYYSPNQNEFATDDDLLNAVVASTAMPIVWPPVPNINLKGGASLKNTVDGGLVNVSPLSDVISVISDSKDDYLVIVVNCNSGSIAKEDFSEKNIAQIALRSLTEITIGEVFDKDIKEFMDKNFIAEQVDRRAHGFKIFDYDQKRDASGKRIKYFDHIVISPETGTLGDTLSANWPLSVHREKEGYKIASEKIHRYIKKHQRKSQT